MTMHIQTYNDINQSGLDLISAAGYHIAADQTNPDAIILRSHNLHETKIHPNCLVVIRAGAGINNLPHQSLLKQGTLCFNTPGANANAVKELVLATFLMSSRHILSAWQATQALTGDSDSLLAQAETLKKQFTGRELRGQTLGVIGLGNIGGMIANTALDLGMRVIGFDPQLGVEHAWRLSSSVHRAHNLNDVLTQSDFITLNAPLNDHTQHLLSKASCQQLKPHACVANFSRAGIVDSEAMLAALQAEPSRRYVCDFPQSCLQQHPQAICLPHLGAGTIEATQHCARMAAQQLIDFIEYGHLTHAIAFPDTQLSQSGQSRLSIINRNEPNMIAQFTQCLSQHQLNITTMINQSQHEYAYNLLDVDEKISATLLQEMQNLPGVIRVRHIY